LGPTGTGKSELALELALRLDGEIVNCDALQVYRGFDAATAKPSLEDRRRVSHHVVDCVGPDRDFNLAEFERLATGALSEIARRGRVPIVAGGTGMYLRGLLRGIVGSPGRDARLRSRIRAIGARRGAAAVHRWLRRLDADSAARIPPGDVQRLARAVEFALLDGGKWSERLRRQGTWQGGEERYRALKIGLTLDRRLLCQRLDARVDRFFDSGLVAEVRRLLGEGVPPTANAFKAIGYREVLAALTEGRDAEGVREEVKRNTRRFAKRQMTWFRREADVVWLDVADGVNVLVDRVMELWTAHRRHEA
jgi:tRNA dimethylallyltransferase